MGHWRIAILAMAFAGLAASPGPGQPSGALARQEGTPQAAAQATPGTPQPLTAGQATPAALATAPAPVPASATTQPPAPSPASAQEAKPAASAGPATNVVSLVAWYANDPSGEFINILPISVDPALVAAELTGSQPVGSADFPDDGPPTVRLGETDFLSYSRGDGDIPERWTWFDDYEGARPATLVMQIEGQGGPYAGYFGTVTFVSRDEGGVGGVIVFALRPPEARSRAANRESKEAAAAQDGAVVGSQPDPSNPDSTDVVSEPSA